MQTGYTSPYPNDGFKGDASYTGLRLEVFGQATAMQYEPGEDEVCISISSGGYGVRMPELSNKFIAICRLDFDDVGLADAGDARAKCIHEVDVNRVVEFIMKHRNRKKMVIHCFAGMSRSRSMAAAIARVLRLPYTFTINNRSVYHKVGVALRDALQKEK